MHTYFLLAAIDKPHRLNLLHVYVTTHIQCLRQDIAGIPRGKLEIGMQLDTLDEHSS